MSKLRTLIVDDEQLARERLQRLLKPHSERIELVGEADSGPAALHQISGLQPDLVFLDIQMPGLNGFEVLAELLEPPHIIFVTAFDRFALKAFEVNAVDYLLKPVRDSRLTSAIHRIPQKAPENEALSALLRYVEVPKKPALERITIKKGNRILFLDAAEIAYFKSEDKYTFAVWEMGEEIVPQSLTELEAGLDTRQFVRIHRGFLINRRFLLEVRRIDANNHQAIVACPKPQALPVSRNGMKLLLGED